MESEVKKYFDYQSKLEGRPKFPRYITDDAVKWLLFPAKTVLEYLCVWPDRQNRVTAVVNVFYISSFFALIIAQIAFIRDKDTDIGSAADACTGIISSFEAVVRRMICVGSAATISNVLSRIYYEFWPSNIAGKDLHNKLKRRSWILVGACFSQTMTGVSWAFLCIIQPLAHHRLPMSAKFWFSNMKSPAYELLYIWEGLMCVDLVTNIFTQDFFLLTIIWQCAAQFRLLREFIVTEFKQVVRRAKVPAAGEKSEAFHLVMVCIRRHNDLIKTCQDIEKMLGIFILVIYLGTIGTVCVSGFLLMVVKQELGKAVPYFLGHMLQILMYCFAGNELILESTKFQDAVYQCGWHLLPNDRDTRKSLVLMMLRSQRQTSVTIGGFGVLSLSSYMKLLQFCFSFFTLLSTMVDKN